MIHRWCKDRKHEASSHTQNLRRRRSRSNIPTKRVEDVRTHNLSVENDAATEIGRSNIRHDLVKLCLGRITLLGKADRNEQTTWNHERNAVPGQGGTTSILLQPSPEAICNLSANLIGKAIADGESEAAVPALGDGLMVLICKKRGERREDEI